MKLTKKLVSLLLAGALMLFILTACNRFEFIQYTKAYDGIAGAAWANSHIHDWHTSGSAYNGKVCADLSSYCLEAGGLQGFTHTNSSTDLAKQLRTYSYFTEYELEFSGSGSNQIRVTGANEGKISVGDIILYIRDAPGVTKFDHTSVVTSIDGNGLITITQWNTDLNYCQTTYSNYTKHDGGTWKAICFHYSNPEEDEIDRINDAFNDYINSSLKK